MKEFDFVKLTLGIAVALTVGLAGTYVWLGMKLRDLDSDIKQVELVAKDVGRMTHDLKTLNDMKQNDKMKDDSVDGIHAYFAEQARQAKIDPNEDYTLRPREKEASKSGAFVDYQYVLDFKKDHLKTREQIIAFIFNVEQRSRRIKLARAKLTLVEDKAADDIWVADSLTFVRRDPSKVEAPKAEPPK
jgi:hypothetical protein